ncbi:hypothetical protein M569_17206, partial [Genlisea aurea]
MLTSTLRATTLSVKTLNSLASYFSTTARDANKVSLYLQRAKLIDSIRLCLRSRVPETTLLDVLKCPSLDSFVVANALRSAPSPASALSLIESLKKLECFSHSRETLYAMAKILAKTGQFDELGALVDDINGGKFSFMDRMRWYADAGNLDEVIGIWQQWRSTLDGHPCTESYNIIMKLYVDKGMDTEALEMFAQITQEGALHNCRTYTIVVQHLIKLGKLDSAMELFQILPHMMVKRTLRQYSLLVEAFTDANRFDVVKALLHEMQLDGILPGRSMLSSLQRMKEAGFDSESKELINDLLPDSRIKQIGYSTDASSDDDDDDVKLKPWLDPAALSSALRNWEPDEVSALEMADIVWSSRLVCKLIRSFKSPETAWEFFSWVARQHRFVHDIYTISRMIAKLARHGRVGLVDNLLLKIKRESMKLSVTTVRLVIDSYGFSKHGEAAVNVFRDVDTLCRRPSRAGRSILYASLLRTLAKCRMDARVMDVLDEMLVSDAVPDLRTFSGLMRHYAVQGDVGTMQRLFGMARQCNLEPDWDMYKILIWGYCRCGRASLAVRALEEMRDSKMVPDRATKGMVVRSLWKQGMLREAAHVEQFNDD